VSAGEKSRTSSYVKFASDLEPSENDLDLDLTGLSLCQGHFLEDSRSLGEVVG